MKPDINILMLFMGFIVIIISIIVIPIFLRKKIENERKWAFVSVIVLVIVYIIFYAIYSWFKLETVISPIDKIKETFIVTIKEVWFSFFIIIVMIIAFIKTSRK